MKYLTQAIYMLHLYITDIKSIRNSIEILLISISRIVHSKSSVKQYISQHWDHVERPDVLHLAKEKSSALQDCDKHSWL